MSHDRAPRRVLAGGLLTAAGSTLAIFAAAPELFPPIPPGPFVLAGAAAASIAPGRWMPVAGVLAACGVLVGGVASGGLPDSFSANTTAAVASVVQTVALIVAAVSGAVALRQAAGGRARDRRGFTRTGHA